MPALSGNLPRAATCHAPTQKCGPASSSSTQSRLRLSHPIRNIWQSPIIWKTPRRLGQPGPASATPRTAGRPPEQPRASASRSCSSVSLGSLAQRRIVVLGDDRPSSGGHAQQRAPESCRRSPPPARGPGAGIEVYAVAERLREPPPQRGPIPQRQVPAGQQDRPAALGFDEAQTAAVDGPENFESWMPRPLHHGRVGGWRHVTESDDALQRQVIQAI